MHIRTKDEILHEFQVRGISISAWARAKGFSGALVYQVISGKKQGVRGQCHQIAVALGLKEGLIGDLGDLPFALTGTQIASTAIRPSNQRDCAFTEPNDRLSGTNAEKGEF